MFGEETEEGKYDDIKLVKAPPKIQEKLVKIRDMVLYRFGSTGVVDIINTVVKTRTFYPVYLVDSLTKYTAYDCMSPTDGAFRDVILIPYGFTLRQIAKAFLLTGSVLYGFGVDGIQIGPDQVLLPSNNIIKIVNVDKD